MCAKESRSTAEAEKCGEPTNHVDHLSSAWVLLASLPVSSHSDPQFSFFTPSPRRGGRVVAWLKAQEVNSPTNAWPRPEEFFGAGPGNPKKWMAGTARNEASPEFTHGALIL